MTPLEAKILLEKNGRLITTYFDEKQNVLLMLPTPKIIDEISGDEIIDDEAAYNLGVNIPNIYGMCINKRYMDWQTSAFFTFYYK